MSKTATSSRPVLTGIDTSGTYPVHYRFSHAKSGNRHLVVVFANFSAPDDYGWSNGVFDNVRANILWVRDMFDGKNSYYLCKDMDFELERSVVTLISNVMHSLGLTPDQCTMWGGSKGGSAALYFGLKYGFRNIVSVVPMFRVGTSVQKRPAIADFMMGGQVTDAKIQVLDRVIPDLVQAEANPAPTSTSCPHRRTRTTACRWSRSCRSSRTTRTSTSSTATHPSSPTTRR